MCKKTEVHTYRRCLSKQHVLEPSPRACFANRLLRWASKTSQAHGQLLITLAQPLTATTS